MHSHLSATAITRRLQQPTRGNKAGIPNRYMILLQMRFAYAIFVTKNAVGSYPAFSPLPAYKMQAVIFCSTFCWQQFYLLPPGR